MVAIACKQGCTCGKHKRDPEVVKRHADLLRGRSLTKCLPDCECGKHQVSQETRELLSQIRRGKRYGVSTEGYLGSDGYFVLTGLQGHPLAVGHSKDRRIQGGEIRRNRKVLWEKLGCTSVTCEHPCHWCGKLLDWTQGSLGICSDHLDGDKLNDTPENLVPSCDACNIRRYLLGNSTNFSTEVCLQRVSDSV